MLSRAPGRRAKARSRSGLFVATFSTFALIASGLIPVVSVERAAAVGYEGTWTRPARVDQGRVLVVGGGLNLAVLRVAGKLAIQIGKDLSVISFDDSPWAAAMSPAITVIARPVDELGRRTVDLLMQEIGSAPRGESLVLPTTLIIRESVAKRASH